MLKLTHMSVIAKAVNKDCGFEQIQHPPHSPDLAPSDFHLFPKLKKAISSTHFQSDDDIIYYTVVDFLDSQGKNFFRPFNITGKSV